MNISNHVTNFLTGTAGTTATFMTVANDVADKVSPAEEKTLIAAIVSIVGGLLTTVLSNLFKKLFHKKK